MDLNTSIQPNVTSSSWRSTRGARGAGGTTEAGLREVLVEPLGGQIEVDRVLVAIAPVPGLHELDRAPRGVVHDSLDVENGGAQLDVDLGAHLGVGQLCRDRLRG